MKIGLSKLKFSFVILFSILLSISPFNPVRLTDPRTSIEVCAADIGYNELGTGIKCTKKAVCPNGTLYERIVNGSIKALDNRNAALNDVKGYKWNGSTTLYDAEACISTNLTGLTYTQRQRNLDNSVGGIGVTHSSGLCTIPNPSLQKVNIYGRGTQTICCPVGYVATGTVHAVSSNREGLDNSYAVAGYGHLGCCPKRSNYITRLNYASNDLGSLQSCEYFTNDENPTFVERVIENENTRIYDDANDLEEVIGPTIEEMTESSSYRFDPGAYPLDLQDQINDEIEQLNRFLTFTCETNPDSDPITLPTIQPRGSIHCGQYLLYTSRINGNASSCPANTCVQLDTADSLNPNPIVPLSLLDIEYKTRECVRCFNENEVIKATDGDGGPELTICKPATSGPQTITMPACNNSIIDTIACLGGSNSASQNADSSGVYDNNYNLCCACREQGGVWTGIGCTDTTPSGLITGLIRIVYGVMGGVALIMLIYAGIMYQTGNEANVKKARESIIRTVTGLIVLTFSILILRVIGINVLDILPTGSI